MNWNKKVAIMAALMVAIGVAIIARESEPSATTPNPSQVAERKTTGATAKPESSGNAAGAAQSSQGAPVQSDSDKLPRLMEFGSVSCIPCKAMEPILDELREEYIGTLRVEFVDVYANRDLAAQYRIRSIPTQIFLDASGNELYRHVGFFPKQEIVAKWEELGVDLKKSAPHSD